MKHKYKSGTLIDYEIASQFRYGIVLSVHKLAGIDKLYYFTFTYYKGKPSVDIVIKNDIMKVSDHIDKSLAEAKTLEYKTIYPNDIVNSYI